jgi:hypothetical protein
MPQGQGSLGMLVGAGKEFGLNCSLGLGLGVNFLNCYRSHYLDDTYMTQEVGGGIVNNIVPARRLCIIASVRGANVFLPTNFVNQRKGMFWNFIFLV